MTTVPPVVRCLIVCEDIRASAEHPIQVSLINLIHSIRSLDDPPFPLTYRELCVFVQLAECRGAGSVEVTIRHEDSGTIAFDGSKYGWVANLPTDPLEVIGLRFRIRDIVFESDGLHTVEFGYNGKVLATAPLKVR